MDLYFLRHGLAGQYGDPKYKDDSLRPLTAQGREKMRLAAQGMLALGLEFDAILSSPYLRARQTAELVAQTYNLKSRAVHLTNGLLAPASFQRILKEILVHFPRSKHILLVGHEPHLTELVSSLLNCSAPLSIDFKKGGLCCLTLDQPQGTATLNWLLTPAQLRALGIKPVRSNS